MQRRKYLRTSGMRRHVTNVDLPGQKPEPGGYYQIRLSALKLVPDVATLIQC
jgi:hypothetical protein